MAERSSARSRSAFSRGRLIVGILIVALAGSGVVYGLARLRGGPDPGRLIYATQDAVFVRELESGRVRKLAALPKDTLDVFPSPDGRWAAYAVRGDELGMIDLTSPRRWTIADKHALPYGWSPDARLIVKDLTPARRLVAVDPDGATRVLADDFLGSRPVWIDDERFLSNVNNDDLTLVRTSGDQTSVSRLTGASWPLAVSPDGRQVLYARRPESAKPTVVVAELRGGRLVSPSTVHRGIGYLAAVGPAGQVAFVGRDERDGQGTWVLQAGSLPPLRVLDGQAEHIEWSRDGSALLYLYRGRVFARDLDDRRATRLTPRGSHIIAFAVVP